MRLPASTCNNPIMEVQQGDRVFFSATNIYLGPTTLSAITFNFLMSLAGGLLAGYIVSKGNAFWTYSSGLPELSLLLPVMISITLFRPC